MAENRIALWKPLRKGLVLAVLVLGCAGSRFSEQPPTSRSPGASASSPRAAMNPPQHQLTAEYLDARAEAWTNFDVAVEHGDGTVGCLSCHTTVPYLLARPVLRQDPNAFTPLEARLFQTVEKRVQNWDATPAWYTSANTAHGVFSSARGRFFDPEKIERQARGSEAVVNALVLAFRDRYAARAQSTEVTRKALANMLAQQERTGPDAGGFPWLMFTLEPWESKASASWGAAVAALAIGTAPGDVWKDASYAEPLRALRFYLRDELARGMSVHNQAFLLWAAARLPGLLEAVERRELQRQLIANQREDGSWSLQGMLPVDVRRSGKPNTAMQGDGYATSVALIALEGTELPLAASRLAAGRRWLIDHQDPISGTWHCYSPSKSHVTILGRQFMTDAATAFAVMALSGAAAKGE